MLSLKQSSAVLESSGPKVAVDGGLKIERCEGSNLDLVFEIIHNRKEMHLKHIVFVTFMLFTNGKFCDYNCRRQGHPSAFIWNRESHPVIFDHDRFVLRQKSLPQDIQSPSPLHVRPCQHGFTSQSS